MFQMADTDYLNGLNVVPLSTNFLLQLIHRYVQGRFGPTMHNLASQFT